MQGQDNNGHRQRDEARRDNGGEDASGDAKGRDNARDSAHARSCVRDAVRGVYLGTPMVDGALTVLPLYSPVRVASKYVLLQQAFERGTMTITEVSDAGSVPHLLAFNKGPWPVLIFDGEELVGAKQNRIANATVLVAMGKTVLPVSCVEAGRWSHRTQSFDSGAYTSHPRMRQQKERQVQACLIAEELPSDAPQAARAMRFRSDQGAIWDEVSRTQVEMGVHSDTSALADTYEAGKDRLETTLKNLTIVPPAAQAQKDGTQRAHRPVGVAVFLGGEFVCLDLLRPGKRFALLYEKLLRGYALEALLRKARVVKGFDPEAATLRLLAELMESGVTEQPSADLGLDLRLEGGQITGSGLVWQDELIQLSLFPKGEVER